MPTKQRSPKEQIDQHDWRYCFLIQCFLRAETTGSCAATQQHRHVGARRLHHQRRTDAGTAHTYPLTLQLPCKKSNSTIGAVHVEANLQLSCNKSNSTAEAERVKANLQLSCNKSNSTTGAVHVKANLQLPCNKSNSTAGPCMWRLPETSTIVAQITLLMHNKKMFDVENEG